jgi:hypothetical protein
MNGEITWFDGLGGIEIHPKDRGSKIFPSFNVSYFHFLFIPIHFTYISIFIYL